MTKTATQTEPRINVTVVSLLDGSIQVCGFCSFSILYFLHLTCFKVYFPKGIDVNGHSIQDLLILWMFFLFILLLNI